MILPTSAGLAFFPGQARGPPSAIVVTNNGVSSVPYIVNVTGQIEPSFPLFSTLGHIVAVRLDGTLVGPASLYPGLSTTAVVAGSAMQAGPLPAKPSCQAGTGVIAGVPANIISPGDRAFGGNYYSQAIGKPCRIGP